MVGEVCPNCGEYTNASTSRLVRDACGHRKCRICLVDEEEGCKACQNYPFRSSPLASVSGDFSTSETCSEKGEMVQQPLELVINKPLDHVQGLFVHQESCGSESSTRHSVWVGEHSINTENNAVDQNSESKRTGKTGIHTFNENEATDPLQLGHHSASDLGFDACDRPMNQEVSVQPQSSIQKLEPLELVTNLRSPPKSEGEHQNSLVQETVYCERNQFQSNHPGNEDVQKPKKRKNCRLKRTHISVIPGVQETYKCDICGKTFKSPTAKRYHDSCLTGIKPYHCTICDRSFVKQSHFQYHERTHTGYKPFECSVCGKAFPQRNKLNRHLHSHQNDKRFKCSICEKGYSSREDLKSHLNVHTGVRPYPCQICKKSFREATNLTRHMHTHSNERPHTCEQCGKSFKDKCLLVRHRRTHGKERPFSCSDCTRVFLSKSELSRHLAVHSDDKPFPCQFCSTVFRRRDNLNRHTRHHHSEDRITSPDKPAPTVETPAVVESKPASVVKQKTRPKSKPKASATLVPKSPAKISVLYLNSHEQIKCRLDSRSNVTPVIRPTSELSNAVPVINGPISIKRPEEKTNSPKKAFTHTEPIPLAEAVVINRRIEEKLYPKSDSNNDCFFHPDFRSSRVERQHPVLKPIREFPLRPNHANKSMLAAKVYSPEVSISELQIPSTALNRVDKFNQTRPFLPQKKLNIQPDVPVLWGECQDSKSINALRHTVPKKRAIEEMRTNPMVAKSPDFTPILTRQRQQSTSIGGQNEPERVNCVPTITKTGNTNGNGDPEEFILPHSGIPDNKGTSGGASSATGGVEKSGVKKLSDIHWRRRTSEILRPRIHGFDSFVNCQLSELEIPEEASVADGKR